MLGAGLFALAAGYAAVFTELSYLRALVVIITLNYYTGDILYDVDNSIGTGGCAKAAAYALLGIYLGNTALGDDYGVSGADLGAIAVAKAGEGTESVACEIHICRLTGLRTCVDILSFLGLAAAVAGNVSDLLDNVLCLNAHNSGNSLCSSVTAGGTETRLVCLSLGESLCVSLAARKAASATVCAGKRVTDLFCSLILLDRKIARCKGEKNRAKQTNSKKE